MLENRKTLAMALGFIIGIIMGLYCKISIVLFYAVIFIIHQVCFKQKKRQKLKLVSIRRYSRYIRIVFNKNAVKVIIISSIMANSVVLYQNYKYDNLYKCFENEEIVCRAVVVSNVQEKEYKDNYKVKVISVNGEPRRFKNTNLYVSIKGNSDEKLEYGQELIIKGKYVTPETRRNYKGFDYKEYLKTLKVYGTINLDSKVIVKDKSISSIFIFSNDLSLKIKNSIEKYFDSKTEGVVLGVVLGDKSKIEKEVAESFSESNISHILAVSGMHMAYVILIFNSVFNGLVGRRYGNVLSISFILLYMFITGFSPSVVRAGSAWIIVLLSEVFRLRSDKWENLATSFVLICIYNPFLIESISVLLSYAGTIGIITLDRKLLEILKSIDEKKEKKNARKKKNKLKILAKLKQNRLIIKLRDAVVLTIAAYIAIAPIVIYSFNKLAVLSLIVAVAVGFLAGPTVILGIIFVLVSFTKIDFIIFSVVYIEKIFVRFIINLSDFGSKFLANNVILVTPNILEIIIYYITLFVSVYLISVFSKRSLNPSEIRIKNLISLLKYRIHQNKTKLISWILVFSVIFTGILFIPKNLKIHFIDVGQGDSTLIVTPKNKKILIDGGGSDSKSFDVGEDTLLPYLLDRRIKTIDYAFISHFDTDHVGGILYLMKNLKVKNVIICKQPEDSDNFKKFKELVKQKNINLIVAKKGDKINIENNLYFSVLWPDSSNTISENVLNNNSLVCKLIYKSFSMLFTGDIEKIAEEAILKEYKNTNKLQSTVLKVAHHGSKSSSIEEFLDVVDPKVAVIGVGKGNRYGHPNIGVLERLENLGTKIYRTDCDGEISIFALGNGSVTVKIKKRLKIVAKI